MTSPRFAQATNQGRYYDIPGYDDITHVSVTNIINALSKPALIGAASKHAGERAIHQETEWHAIQQEEGDEAARKYISAAFREYTAYRADLGSAVHFCCEVFDEHVIAEPEFVAFDAYLIDYVTEHWAEPMSKHRGTVAKNVELIRKHVEQYDKACREKGLVFLDRERTVCSPAHGYAGTLDGIVHFGTAHSAEYDEAVEEYFRVEERLTGTSSRDEYEATKASRTYVLDIKTGFVSAESVPLQLAAYRFASHEVHGNATQKRTHYAQGGLVLQLKPASYKLFPVRCDVEVFSAFLDVKKVWEWQNGLSKTAIGEEWL